KIHFEISERKVLLRAFDILFVLLSLYVIGQWFHFDYFNLTSSNFYWAIVLGLYITVFGSVFEMYNLQVASNQFQIIRSIMLTASSTVLFYLLTPWYTPILPSNRMQILYFYLAILGALFLWRMFYLNYLASHRFGKKVLIVCDADQCEELVAALARVDPHYVVAGYV